MLTSKLEKHSLLPPGQNLIEVMVGECKINSSEFSSYVAVVSKPRMLVPIKNNSYKMQADFQIKRNTYSKLTIIAVVISNFGQSSVHAKLKLNDSTERSIWLNSATSFYLTKLWHTLHHFCTHIKAFSSHWINIFAKLQKLALSSSLLLHIFF